MRVELKLKGINRVRKKRADGSIAIYYYAWKGGPRLKGEPGTPEFIASYNDALNWRKRNPPEVLATILDAYESSSDFATLAERTRGDYKRHLRTIAAKFGDYPLAAISDRRTRGEFLAWRDRLADASIRGADYVFAVFARALSWAADRGHIALNPLERMGRLYKANRNDSIWSDEDEAAFYAKAPAHLHLALTLALWTGQRQGDLLHLTWTAYDGAKIRLKQRKTKKQVTIPVGAPLKLALDRAREQMKDAVTILTTKSGRAWTESGFRTSWRKACKKAGVRNVTFHDLRGTAVTHLALSGCTEAEIATITGHSLRDVGAVLDAHYLKRDDGLAESAIRKLETRTKRPTKCPTEA